MTAANRRVLTTAQFALWRCITNLANLAQRAGENAGSLKALKFEVFVAEMEYENVRSAVCWLESVFVGRSC